MGICTNYVVGEFGNISETEMVIPVPSAEKIIFRVDSGTVLVSMNNNLDYMQYRNDDGVIEFASHEIDITKIYVKSLFSGATGRIRVWAYI
jgi:hypothetical protein